MPVIIAIAALVIRESLVEISERVHEVVLEDELLERGRDDAERNEDRSQRE